MANGDVTQLSDQDLLAQIPNDQLVSLIQPQQTPQQINQQTRSQLDVLSRPSDPVSDFFQGATESPAGQALTGVGQGAANLILGTANLERKALEGIGILKPGGDVKQQATGLLGEAGVNLQPQTGAAKGGKVAFDIGTFAAPGTGLLKLKQTFKGANLLGRSKVAQVGLTAVAEGLTGLGISAVQQGEFDNTAKSVGLLSAIFPLAGAVIKRPLGALGDKILQRVFKPTKADFKAGFSVKTLADEGIEGSNLGSLLEGVGTKIKSIKDQIQPLLQGQGNVNTMDLVSRVLTKVRPVLGKDVAKSTQLQGAVNQFVKNIMNKSTPQTLSSGASIGKQLPTLNINQLDNIRASFGEIANFNTIGITPSLTAKKQIAKIIWRESKDLLEETVTQGPKLNALRGRLSKLIPIMEAGNKTLRAPNNNLAIGLMDSIFASGGLISGINQGMIMDPRFLAAIAANHAQRSPFIANLFRRASGQLEKPLLAQTLLEDFVKSSAKVGVQEISRNPTDSQPATTGQ